MRLLGCFFLGFALPVLMILELVFIGVYQREASLFLTLVASVNFIFIALLVNEYLIKPSISDESNSAATFLFFMIGVWAILIPYLEFHFVRKISSSILSRIDLLVAVML